jgi:pyruvate/2-oxoglutarate/acetoin dehydrogenase E1 component
VPEEEYTIPFGVADIKREGNDITIVATSRMVLVALAAAEMLEVTGISAEVVDVRTTFPLDKQALIESRACYSNIETIWGQRTMERERESHRMNSMADIRNPLKRVNAHQRA